MGVCEATGDGRLDYDAASKWISYLNGNNPGGVKISWINWSFGDKDESCSALRPISCDNK